MTRNLAYRHYARLNEVLLRENKSCVEFIINQSENIDHQDREQRSQAEYMGDDIRNMRLILLSKSFKSEFNKATSFVTCGQVENSEGFMLFNTHSADDVVRTLCNEIRKAMRRKELTVRLESLLALTIALKEYDFWLSNSKLSGPHGKLEQGITLLGESWKTLLRNSNTALGIDAEFTRPGILALLEQFRSMVQAQPMVRNKFTWK